MPDRSDYPKAGVSGDLYPAAGPTDLETVLDSLEDGLILLDHRGCCRYLNKAASQFFSRPRAALLGQSFWDLAPEAATGLVRDAFELSLRDGVTVEVESTIPPAPGSYNLRASPLDGKLWVRMRDISQRKAEDLGVRSLARIFSDAADSILILDLDGRVLRMNEEAERMFRRESEEIVGRSITTLIPEEFHKETKEMLARCLRGENVRNFETTRWRADGEIVSMLTTMSLITDDAGGPVAITAIAKDISEIKRAERTLRVQRATLAQQARQTTVSELAAGLAHELNQPLAAIGHYCDAALSLARPENSELMEIVREAAEQAERAANIIRNLRSQIGKRPEQKSHRNLNALIKTTARFLRAEARARRIRIQLSLDKDLPDVLINEVEIQQVLTNVILNSMEAIEDAQSDRRRVKITTRHVGDAAEVKIQDTGPGIDPEVLGTTFAPFQTDKPHGLGLGLWICQSILLAHRSRLWAEAGPDGGAILRFDLPLTDSDPHVE